ncbi:hypothetical protein ACROYT_G041813 [Oculina patagonica]
MSIVSAPAFLGNDASPDPDFEATPQLEPPKSVTGVEPFRLKKSKTTGRSRKMTERGMAYHLEIKLANRNSAYRRLKQQMEKINAMRDSPDAPIEQLEERFHLDRFKDEFDVPHKEHDDLLELEEEREASYRWFDVRDREFFECRMRLCERIQALERKSSRAPSMKSGHSKGSKLSDRSKISSRGSSSTKHLSLALVDAAAKAAKLQAEMEFLEKEKELRRLQLEKELTIASAEEKAIKRILENERLVADKEVLSVKGVKQELKPDVSDQNIKQERSLTPNPLAPAFVSTPSLEPLRPNSAPHFQNSDVNTALQDNAPSNKDRLYFLDKYTSGKANQVVKGFLAMTSDSAYGKARKMLDDRFGNPIHVAEAYKSRLRNWPKVIDGDSSGIQDFADFLVRCEEAMKKMQSTGDLDSTETLRLVSSKLPSYSGVKWCRHAHDIQKKTKKIVTFSAFVKFVGEEADVANDPVFSPNALKADRKKPDNQIRSGWKNRQKKRDDSKQSANTFATSTTPPPNSLVPPSPANQAAQACPPLRWSTCSRQV